MRQTITSLKNYLRFIFYILCVLLSTGMSHAADPIGVLSVVIGSVSIERDDSVIKGESKLQVFENDLIITGGKSRAQVLLLDQTAIYISQNAELTLDKFVYSGDEDSVSLKVTKGTFRFISGQVAKKTPEKVNIETPVATIGIRGTEFLGHIHEVESVFHLFSGKIEVANDIYTQHIVAPGHHVTIDPAGLISTPVKLSDEKLNVLVDRVSHHKSALDNDVPESSREKDEGEHEEDD